jgi:hypothetical protein
MNVFADEVRISRASLSPWAEKEETSWLIRIDLNYRLPRSEERMLDCPLS